MYELHVKLTKLIYRSIELFLLIQMMLKEEGLNEEYWQAYYLDSIVIV